MRRSLLFAAGVFCGSSLALAADKPKEITWQDYTQATTAAKKTHQPVLIDFWRPG